MSAAMILCVMDAVLVMSNSIRKPKMTKINLYSIKKIPEILQIFLEIGFDFDLILLIFNLQHVEKNQVENSW